MSPAPEGFDALAALWRSEWEGALALWSRYTKLRPPLLLVDEHDELRHGLTSSFAAIRLADTTVVVSLRKVRALGLEGFARVILGHEIGHHVYAPACLRDGARLLARLRAALGTLKDRAPTVANLYADLLINDRLQRDHGLDVAAVYARLPAGEGPVSRVWTLYMRIYEVLWSLPSGTLAPAERAPALEGDAGLGARLVRAYARDWLRGAGRFGALLLPWMIEDGEGRGEGRFAPFLDALGAGAGDEVPDGLAEIDGDEEGGAVHPAEDPVLSGVPRPADDVRDGGDRRQPRTPREPGSFVDLMRSLGVTLGDRELLQRYYRELAAPHLVPFPSRLRPRALDPLPEGLDVWDAGEPLADLDVVESASRSPLVVPGVTTLRRVFGTSEGGEPERRPVDLYVGIDCSGSMPNPAASLSHPVVAGAVVALSALRAGAHVMVTLSGEPGSYSSTEEFTRDERLVLRVLTGYLGTGYAFGVNQLGRTFLGGPPPARPTHVLVCSDSDWFAMLDRHAGGWDMARDAAARAGGGATAVLRLPASAAGCDNVRRLEACGWRVHLVADLPGLVGFARAFARAVYAQEAHREVNP